MICGTVKGNRNMGLKEIFKKQFNILMKTIKIKRYMKNQIKFGFVGFKDWKMLRN